MKTNWLAGMMIFGSTSAQALTLQDVETALQRGEASWTSAPSVLPADSLSRQGGAAVEEPDETLAQLVAKNSAARLDKVANRPTASSMALPTHFDWRDVEGRSFVPASQPQGTCGSCVAFALAATLEASLNIACDEQVPAFQLSRQYLHSCGGASCRSGWQLSQAAAFAASSGVPDASCFPYSGDDAACSNACADANGRKVKAMAVERPTRGVIDVEAIKRALLKGPLLSSLILFEDLEFYGGGVYRHVTGRQVGSHAVTIVGWNDADRAWIALNSWGEGWGDQGFFLVGWTDASLPGRYTYAFDVASGRSSEACAMAR